MRRLIFTVLLAAGPAIAAEAPPELQRPLAAGERFYDPHSACSTRLLSLVPSPASYVEVKHRTTWPTTPDAERIIRSGLQRSSPNAKPSALTTVVDLMLERRDWAVVSITFDSKNVFGSTIRTEVECLVQPLFGSVAPVPVIEEVPNDERCSFALLCEGR